MRVLVKDVLNEGMVSLKAKEMASQQARGLQIGGAQADSTQTGALQARRPYSGLLRFGCPQFRRLQLGCLQTGYPSCGEPDHW